LSGVIEHTASRVCGLTRLRLVAPPPEWLYRVGRSKWGPMNPPQRDHGPAKAWSRWDTPGGRTLYAAATAEAAFGEVVAYLKESLPTAPLSNFFDDVTPDETGLSLAGAVRAEMPNTPMHTAVNAGWRDKRRLYRLTPPPTGWFVEICHADSVAALNAAANPPHPGRLTLSDLTGEDRALTTKIARWVRMRVLDDGSQPLGIRYVSKHGSNLDVYALWLRQVDDDKDLSREPTKLKSEQLIKIDHPDLRAAAHRNGLKIF